MTRSRILLVIFVSFFISRVVLAGSIVSTDFEMLLPRPFQQNLIEQHWQALQREEFKLNWQITDQIFDTPDVKVYLTGIELAVKTKLQKPEVASDESTLTLQSRDLQADLTIGLINVDQYIEREVGGVIGRFRIQARCENVLLHMKEGKGAFKIKLSPVFQRSLVKSRLDDAELEWTPDAWSATRLECTGAEGFEDIVQKEIFKLTGNASQLTAQKEALMAYVQNYLDTKSLDLSRPRVFAVSRPDIRAGFSVEEFSGAGDQARVKGRIRVEFLKSKSDKNLHFKLSSGSLQGPNPENAFIKIPEDFIEAMVEEAFAANSWSQRVSSDRIPGFSSLMSSRFIQFFVWPALLKFSKKADFLFDVYSAKDIQLSGERLIYKIRMDLNARMYAPEGRGYLPFMRFTVPLSSRIKLSMAEGRIQAQFSQVDLELYHQWEASYFYYHNVSRRFLSNKIEKRVLESVNGTRISYDLPEIPVADGISLRIIKAVPYQNSQDILIYLK